MPASRAAGRQPNTALVAAGVVGAMFLAAMEATVVATAMPTVVSSPGGLRICSWAFSAFLVAAPITTPIWGRLADQVGCRRAYLGGRGVFLVTPASAFLSPSGQARDLAAAPEPVASAGS